MRQRERHEAEFFFIENACLLLDNQFLRLIASKCRFIKAGQ